MYRLKKTQFVSAFYAAFICVAGSALAADYSPDIRPGLWETQVSLKGDMADAISAQLASLPKEAQQLLRDKIANLPQELGSIEKECITAEQAKKYFYDVMGDEDCKNDLQWTGKGHGTLISTCSDGTKQQSDIRINGPKEITVTSNVTQANGISGTSIWHGRWLNDDCGMVESEN